MTSPSHSARNLFGSRRNAVSASASNASSEGALTVRHASGSADVGSVMAPVLGESGQAAKARACLPVGPIDGAEKLTAAPQWASVGQINGLKKR